jgi:hypothetical protein
MLSLLGTDSYMDSRICSLERKIAQLESENYRLRLTQQFDRIERNLTFWFGLMLFSGIALMIVLGWHWR